jgi:hypothetical protein
MLVAIVASRVYQQLAAIARTDSVFCGISDNGNLLGPHASLVAIGDAMPEAYASVGLIVTIRKNCLYSPLSVGDAFDSLPNGHIMRGVHVTTEGAKLLGAQWVHPILLKTCSKRLKASMRPMANA